LTLAAGSSSRPGCIRAVNAACGLGPAATHYHFGSKEQLVHPVILDHGETIRKAIMDRVEILAAREIPPSTRELFETLVAPYLELMRASRSAALGL
jgi:AcrR family transcriptional regulator